MPDRHTSSTTSSNAASPAAVGVNNKDDIFSDGIFDVSSSFDDEVSSSLKRRGAELSDDLDDVGYVGGETLEEEEQQQKQSAIASTSCAPLAASKPWSDMVFSDSEGK